MEKEIVIEPQNIVKFLTNKENAVDTIYAYKHESFYFNCKFKVLENKDIEVIDINGAKPENSNAFYTIKNDLGAVSIENFFKYLIVHYVFLAALNFVKNDLIIFYTAIKFSTESGKDLEFSSMLYFRKDIYLIGLNQKANEYIKSNYYVYHFFDSIKKVESDKISDIDLVIHKDTVYLDIFLTKGLDIAIKKSLFNQKEIEDLINFKRTVKKELRFNEFMNKTFDFSKK